MAKCIFSQEEMAHMEEHLHLLTDKEKYVFNLFHRRGWSIEDIAADMDVCRSTVDRKLRSARKILLPYK